MLLLLLLLLDAGLTRLTSAAAAGSATSSAATPATAAVICKVTALAAALTCCRWTTWLKVCISSSRLRSLAYPNAAAAAGILLITANPSRGISAPANSSSIFKYRLQV
jgi:hypothetical protein